MDRGLSWRLQVGKTQSGLRFGETLVGSWDAHASLTLTACVSCIWSWIRTKGDSLMIGIKWEDSSELNLDKSLLISSNCTLKLLIALLESID